MTTTSYQNPILPGFHPDPSICRVGEDYFLVNSSFAYFPGVPVFHSRDLIHWRQIGACLDRPEQLPLQGKGISGGIFAPSIRYHAGVFYMITTNVSGGGNFYVTTRDPFGSWSNPVWVKQAGIDPSLLFDNGHVYLTSTGMLDDPGQKGQGIIQSEIDVTTGDLLTKPRLIWSGTGCAYPEGPHLYHIGNKYYLMIAEGGTEYGHTEVIARSDSPWGPWESCPHNPILSHRSHHSPIQALGHADLVEAGDGSWWAVCLGIRPVFPQNHHLGRETFLAPVAWDEAGWPTIGIKGRIDLEVDAPHLTPVLWKQPAERDDFVTSRLDLKWNFMGIPDPKNWSLMERPGYLCLSGKANRLDDGMGVSWVGCRQEHFNCDVAACLDFSPEVDGDEAGLTVWKDSRHHYDLFVERKNGKRFVGVYKRIGSLAARVAQEEIPDGRVTLLVRSNRMFYVFAFLAEDGSEHFLAVAETRYLSSEVTGGFTGVYFALYASGNGSSSSAPAYFDWFDYCITGQSEFLSLDSSVSQLLRVDAARDILGRYLPGLVAHPPAEWGANLSLLELSAMSPEEISSVVLPKIESDLRKMRIELPKNNERMKP